MKPRWSIGAVMCLVYNDYIWLMTEKEYLLIFEVIIYAGIITQFLLGWSKMIKERGHYKVYWLHLLLTINVFLATVQMYYARKSLDHFEKITNSFTFIIFGLIPLASVFMITFLIFPKTNVNVDFKEFMRREFRVPYAILTIVPLAYTMQRNIEKALLKDTMDVDTYLSIVPHIIFAIMLCILIFNKSLKYFATWGILSFVLISYFVVMH